MIWSILNWYGQRARPFNISKGSIQNSKNDQRLFNFKGVHLTRNIQSEVCVKICENNLK